MVLFLCQNRGEYNQFVFPAEHGLIAEILPSVCPPQCRAFGRDLLEGKSNSPLIPGGRGKLRLKMTSALLLSLKLQSCQDRHFVIIEEISVIN